MFDATINLGHILNTVLMLLGGLYFVWQIKSDLIVLIKETNLRHEANTSQFTDIKSEFAAINMQLSKLAEATIELAKHDIRMNIIDQRLMELTLKLNGPGNGNGRGVKRRR